MIISRRVALEQIARVGGIGAAAAAMQTLGMFGPMIASARPALAPNDGAGKHVIVLGAGIAGLVTAYELEQAGFIVTVLEARHRVGGRAWTIRDGDTLEMMGEETQTAHFSPGVYFNAGPARLPSWHEGILGYAHKFDVPLEVEVNSSRSAYIVAQDGSKVRFKTAVNDVRGELSELLAKAVRGGSLDASLTPGEKAKLLPFLKNYGDLDEKGNFSGTSRSGFATLPGAGTSSFATPVAPVPLDTLLANEQLAATIFEDNPFMQATMFQPVGGMDRIAAGIERNLKQHAIQGAEVVKIRQDAGKVTITYVDRASGKANTVSGDYAVSTIPFNILSRIDADFTKPFATAIAGVPYDKASKVAFEAPRFWEKEQIYGGISFTGGETGLIWYPSAGLMSARGMLLGCYSVGPSAQAFEQRSIANQIALARASIEKVHPGHGVDCVNPLAVNWSKVRYSEGPWPAWDNHPAGLQEAHIDTPGFRLLNTPDRRIFFAGAALSQTPGWQEGAVQSAHAAIASLMNQIASRATTAPASSRATRSA